jgi:integrase/recombinase XerC/integrase/recombinase XerD
MSQNSQENQIRMTASNSVKEAFFEFILSRQAMYCTEATIKAYQYNLGRFMEFLEKEVVEDVSEIKAKHVRGFLFGMREQGLSDSYIHIFARNIKTFMRFLLEEEYRQKIFNITMPKIAKKKLPVLDAKELKKLINGTTSVRNQAIVMTLADTGVRKSELLSLDWGDIDLQRGNVTVRSGKGRKYRSVVLGAKSRRVLLNYRRTVEHNDEDPLFQNSKGRRLTGPAIQSIFYRLRRTTGIYVTPHALRRTFATLSLRAGMNVLHLQGLLGHSTLEMTRRYVHMTDADYVNAHRKYGPIDNLS